MEAVFEGDAFRIDAQAVGAGRLAMQTFAASAWIGGVTDFFSGAGAGEGVALGDELVERGLVGGASLALVENRAVPVEAESFEGTEYGIGGAGDTAGRVDVFHADEPLALVGVGIEVTGDGGNEGAEVEGTRGGGRETAYVLGLREKGMVGAHRLELWTSCL